MYVCMYEYMYVCTMYDITTHLEKINLKIRAISKGHSIEEKEYGALVK
jgi:hypothetical protein